MVHRTHFGNGEQVRSKRLQRLSLIVFENVIGQLICFIEGAAVDLAKLAQIQFGIRPTGIAVFVGQIIAQPVGIAHVAAEQRAHRIEREATLVGILEQRKKRIMRGVLRSSRCRHLIRRGVSPGKLAGRGAGGERQSGSADERCAYQFHIEITP